MRTIPVPTRNPVSPTQGSAVPRQAQTTNLRADAGALSAPAGALVQAGQEAQGLGTYLEKVAHNSVQVEKARQAQVDKGRLAMEESTRMETAAGIEAAFEQAKDAPESWSRIAEKAWTAHDKLTDERVKKEGWSQELIAQNKLATQLYRAKVGIRFKAEQGKALVRQSNARLEANAQAKLRAGDIDGFVESMDKLDAWPDQKEARIREGLEAGTYQIAVNQLDALRSLPPKQAIDGIQRFTEALNAKGEDGKYEEFEYERGGMSQGQRMQVTTMAQQRTREAERAMDVTGRKVIADIRMGRATEADLVNLVKAGQITQDTAIALAPEVSDAISEWDGKVEAREERKRARAQEKSQQQATKEEQLRSAAFSRGNVGVRDIDQQVLRGEISPTQAEKLKVELELASRSEMAMSEGDYAHIKKSIDGFYANSWGFGGQPTDAEYRAVQEEIAGSRYLTKETRLKLMDDLLLAKLTDIADLEEEGPEDRTFADRTISATEAGMRRDVIKRYHSLLPALGPVTAGDLLLEQESEIRNFFDTAKPGSPRTRPEIETFMRERILPPINKAAAQETINEAFRDL